MSIYDLPIDAEFCADFKNVYFLYTYLADFLSYDHLKAEKGPFWGKGAFFGLKIPITRKFRKIGIQRYTFLKSAQNSASNGRSYIDIWGTFKICKQFLYAVFKWVMRTLAPLQLTQNRWFCIRNTSIQRLKPVEHAFHEKVSYVPCPTFSITR